MIMTMATPRLPSGLPLRVGWEMLPRRCLGIMAMEFQDTPSRSSTTRNSSGNHNISSSSKHTNSNSSSNSSALGAVRGG